VRGGGKLGQEHFKHAVGVPRNVVVPNSNNAISKPRQLGVTQRVSTIVRVLAAVTSTTSRASRQRKSA
jgi:hypothetical protein